MIAVVCPSRGRPTRARAMVESAYATAEGKVRVVVVVDSDDSALPEYQAAIPDLLVIEPGGRFTGAANAGAAAVDAEIIGVFGDDVLFRSKGWDRQVEAALTSPGIAYPDDLAHGKNHPTGIFMSREIARALGWIALPAVWHTWADDAWKRIGAESGCLRYVPGAVIEHMHPAYGKAEQDAGYDRAYSKETGDHDYPAFRAWLKAGLRSDLAKVRAVL